MTYYEVPVCDRVGAVSYDLNASRYLVDSFYQSGAANQLECGRAVGGPLYAGRHPPFGRAVIRFPRDTQNKKAALDARPFL